MKNLEFPIIKTKSPAGTPGYNLSDPGDRQAYFRLKAGPEIAKLKEYLKKNTFLAIMLGKKSSGKGTYAKLFKEALGVDNVVHLSVGDVVRSVDEEVRNPAKLKKLEEYLRRNYRGWQSLEEIIEAQKSRSTEFLLPTEYILTLIKREIDRLQGKAIFLDGFPRDLDQISYSLFFRDLAGYRDDPDFLVLIDIPNLVIDARMRTRVICPVCQTPRNTKLLPTKKIGYDTETDDYYLVCDNPECKKAKMVAKEGDEKGIEPIKERLDKDEELIRRAFRLYGIPKILLRNTIPTAKVKEAVDAYEVTPEYTYSWNQQKREVKIKERPWVFEDENGWQAVSLLPHPVAVSLIKQLADLL